MHQVRPFPGKADIFLYVKEGQVDIVTVRLVPVGPDLTSEMGRGSLTAPETPCQLTAVPQSSQRDCWRS